MSPTKKITVNDVEITISQTNGIEDYISLTDMVQAKPGDNRPDMVIQNWLRNKDTIEFLGLWENINNPIFKPLEFEGFRLQAGTNRFVLTPKQWIEKTCAIGIISKAGRYGGTYAHKDIAFEFGSWISPSFKLYLIKEYQRLKEAENNPLQLQWDVHRILSKVNYKLHTDAVKEYIIPKNTEKGWLYAEEADLLNLALWGCTSKQWQEANPAQTLKGLNLRDVATISELIVMVNIEAYNAQLIKEDIAKEQRFKMLRKMAQHQLETLNKMDVSRNFRAITGAVEKQLIDK